MDDQSRLNIKRNSEKESLCLQCMKCCKSLTFEIPSEQSSIHFYYERGLKIKTVSVKDGFRSFVSVPHVCQHLSENGCRINDNKPLSCINYDGRKDLFLSSECLWNKLKDGDKNA